MSRRSKVKLYPGHRKCIRLSVWSEDPFKLIFFLLIKDSLWVYNVRHCKWRLLLFPLTPQTTAWGEREGQSIWEKSIPLTGCCCIKRHEVTQMQDGWQGPNQFHAQSDQWRAEEWSMPGCYWPTALLLPWNQWCSVQYLSLGMQHISNVCARL